MITPKSMWWYRNPYGGKAPGSYPERVAAEDVDRYQFGSVVTNTGLVAMSTYEVLASQLLADGRRERLVLGFNDGLLATAYPDYHMAAAVVGAANQWTVEEWLSRDDRLYGMVLITTAVPERAIEEIHRHGENPRMVGIAMGLNVLGKPFGHAIYHPIYRAAAELQLPLVIQVGSDAATDLPTQPIAGGPAATFAEYDAFSVGAPATHVASMIIAGVFELFPSLKVLVVGGGATWVPGFLWRLNYWFNTIRSEAPWLRELPSEYFVRHVRLGTYSLETVPEPEQLRSALETVPGVESSLVYTSCYPNLDFSEPDEVARRLPSEWHDRVFQGNARELFRWPQTRTRQQEEGGR
jgi:predicted TIM-barrel fold metal-dependent hydrolase